MPEKSLGAMLRASCMKWDTKIAMMVWTKSGYQNLSYSGLAKKVRRYCTGVDTLGLSPGDKLVILSENCAEWAWIDWACQCFGIVVVPIYPTLPKDQTQYIVENCEAKVVVAGGEEQAAKIDGLHGVRVELLRSLADLCEQSLEMPDEEWNRRIDQVKPEDLATIIYTSGTTGNPKGAMLLHGGITFNCEAVIASYPIDNRDTFFTFLPMSHVFERMAGQMLTISCGATIGFAGSLRTLMDDVLKVQPTIMLCVPRFLDAMRTRILESAAKSSPLKHKLFHLGLSQGLKHARGGFAPLYFLTDKLVGAKIRARLGGNIRFIVSGGAALPRHVADFFDAVGLPVLQGYGLTETTGMTCVNRPEEPNPDTIGPQIPGIEMSLAEDGEILVRGPSVMAGYFKLPEDTKNAIDSEGWFHTGDIGVQVGTHIKITDRKKDLLVLGNGKNVAPQPIENKLRESPFIAEAVLFGDGMEYVCALILPEFEPIRKELALAKMSEQDMASLDSVKALVKREIDTANKTLADFEKVKKHSLLTHGFSVESGELTPTMKVKRRVVKEKYKEMIEAMGR